MPKLLVFQHVVSEPLGHLDPLLRESGCRIRYVNFGREPQAEPDVRRYDGLVVLGGPMNVDQAAQFPHLRTEMAIIRDAVLAGVQVPPGQAERFAQHLRELRYAYTEETGNPAYRMFLGD